MKIKFLKIPHFVYFSIFFISFTWFLLIILAPVLYSTGGFLSEIGSYIYLFYSKTCHQIDSRSFKIFGYKLAVCSRCSSVYFGFFLSVVIYPLFRNIKNEKLPAIWYLLIPFVMMAADSLFDLFDILKNSYVSRSLTGFLTGFVLPFYLIPGFVNFFNQLQRTFVKKKNDDTL